MIDTRRVALDGIILLEASIGRLHQALRINLTIKVLLSSLQLRSKLMRYDLLLLIAIATLHDLVDANAAIVAELDGPAGALVTAMLSELFQPVDILLGLVRVEHAQVVEEICVCDTILHTQ